MVALCASLVLTPLVRRMCERYGGLDEPRDERRIHTTAIPRLGGVAVFLALIIALAALFSLYSALEYSLNLLKKMKLARETARREKKLRKELKHHGATNPR